MGLFLFSCRLIKICKISQKRFSCRCCSTIFSLSSGFGKCGVSVIRVSGPKALAAINQLVAPEFNPIPRYASLKTFRHPVNKEIIDRGLLLWFPGPNSFTGEDSCEFQVHGSVAVIYAMLDALSHVAGLRLAKPGEFTKRAFFNGKLDLTEVEGLADLIHSETEAQRKQALLQSTGALSRIYKSWRKRLIRSIAHLEAYIDFAEDENIEDNIVDELKTDLNKLVSEIRQHLNDQRQGELLRHGVKTVIIGEPNVGKSSLLNLICQKKVSIVTSIAGTTRDIIESAYNIGGYPVIFADTAGLRKKTEDVVEAEGISRAIDYLEHSDLIVLMIDATKLISFINKENKNVEEYSASYLDCLGVSSEQLGIKPVLTIVNKVDLLPDQDIKRLQKFTNLPLISCKEAVNIDNLLNTLTDTLKEMCGQPSAESPRLTQSRYRHYLSECTGHLLDFLENYNPAEMNSDLAIAAQKLRKAVRCIEQITGNVSTDEILDVIFRDFCIGK